jgi:hypothetical protein
MLVLPLSGVFVRVEGIDHLWADLGSLDGEATEAKRWEGGVCVTIS